MFLTPKRKIRTTLKIYLITEKKSKAGVQENWIVFFKQIDYEIGWIFLACISIDTEIYLIYSQEIFELDEELGHTEFDVQRGRVSV